MQTSTTIAECKEKVTSAVSPTLVLSSKSSMQSEDSKQQDDIGNMEDEENTTETEVQNSETERDTDLITSFSNLGVSDSTLDENQETKTEDKLESNENAVQKLHMASDKEDSKVQEGDNESVLDCSNLFVDNEVGRNVEHLPKPITAETGAIPKTKPHNVRHNEINTKLNQKKILDVKLTEAAAGDSGIVIDGEESEATIPKATCVNLPDLLTHPQSDQTGNIPKYKHETVPKGVVSEVRSTDLSQEREVTRGDTGEIVNENVKDTIDHQLQYAQQMSTLSMDEGDQGDMEKVNALSYPGIYATNQLCQSSPIFTLGPYGKGAGKFI